MTKAEVICCDEEAATSLQSQSIVRSGGRWVFASRTSVIQQLYPAAFDPRLIPQLPYSSL